jgi:hypothetical protein
MPWAIHVNSKTTAVSRSYGMLRGTFVADDRLELPTLGYEPNVLPLHQSTI